MTVNKSARLIRPDDALVLQSVIAPLWGNPDDPAGFRDKCRRKGYKASQVIKARVGVLQDLGFASIQIPAEQCQGDPIVRDLGDGLQGVFARRKVYTVRADGTEEEIRLPIEEEDENDDREMKSATRGTWKRLKRCRSKLRKWLDALDQDDPVAVEVESIIEELTEAIEEMMPDPDDEDDDEPADEESLKMLADVEGKLAELHHFSRGV